MADKTRANFSLLVAQFRPAMFGLVFLACAGKRFDEIFSETAAKTPSGSVARPVTLRCFDKDSKGTSSGGHCMFTDAQLGHNLIDRAHRDFKTKQIEFLANVVRQYRGEDFHLTEVYNVLLKRHFPGGNYVETVGLSKFAVCAKSTSKN